MNLLKGTLPHPGPQTSEPPEEESDSLAPYTVQVTLVGTADLLLNRWSESQDSLESRVHRDSSGELCLPGESLRLAIIQASRFPPVFAPIGMTPRELLNAALLTLTPLASLGVTRWDYEHRSRVRDQGRFLTRVRPALRAGWRATIRLQGNLPQFVPGELLYQLTRTAGCLGGVGDFRPTFGRFDVAQFEILAP